MKYHYLLFISCCFTVGASAQSTIGEFISNASNTTHLEAIASNFGLTGFLQDSTDITVFVPSDQAIENYAVSMGMEIEDFLLSAEADKMVQYHVLPNQLVLFAEIEDEMEVLTALGTSMSCSTSNGNGSANAASIGTADVVLDNGVVHLLDEVVLPSMSVYDWIDASTNHNYVKIAIDNAGLTDMFQMLTTMTFFAPTDAAFIDFADANGITIYDILYNPDLSTILMNHLLEESLLYASDLLAATANIAASGEGLYVFTDGSGDAVVNGVAITNTDALTHNGLVHTIGGIIEPITLLSEVLQAQGLTYMDTLLTAVGLNPTLNFEGTSFTLFAPTDSAILNFLSATENTLENILADQEGLLEGLLYHLTEGMAFADQLSDGMEITMASSPLEYTTVSFEGDSVYINESLITATDFLSFNGVVHVIDRVMEQPETGCTDEDACNYNEEAAIDDGSCYNLDALISTTGNVCAGGADGAIVVDSLFDAQTSAIAYSLFALDGTLLFENETGSFESLSAGSYFVGVQDGDECGQLFLVDVIGPDAEALELQASSSQNEDGTIEGSVVVTGGLEPYDVTWTNQSTMEVADASDLANGTYIVAVTDAYGCQVEIEIIVDYSSGIGSNDSDTFSMYPNPTNGLFQVQWTQNGPVQLNVFSANGRRVIEWNGTSNARSTFDLSGLPNGIYTVQVIQKEAVTQESLLKND